MPLRDHFHPPLSNRHHWDNFHGGWAFEIRNDLNRRLPERYLAEATTHGGQRVEIDVATWEQEDVRAHGDTGNGAVATLPAVETATCTVPAVFADDFEVRVLGEENGGLRLVAAIELVSPRNKDRAEARRAFAVKCASLLYQGVGLIVVDVVTGRRANLHNAILELLPQATAAALPEEQALYAVGYRPVRRAGQELIDCWVRPLAVGAALPALPLFLNAREGLAVDFEATYEESCRHNRIR
jgi:hypothetical protein